MNGDSEDMLCKIFSLKYVSTPANEKSDLFYHGTRLTYNYPHLRSTKESLTIFWVKIIWVKFFLGENFLGEIFFGEIFLGEKFWGENFLGEIFEILGVKNFKG